MSKQSIYLKVGGMKCDHCVREIQTTVDNVKGVLATSINRDEGKIEVDYDNTGTTMWAIVDKLEDIGYEPTVIKYGNHLM